MAAFGYSPITGYTQMFRTVFINGQTGGLNARNIGEFCYSRTIDLYCSGFAVANSAGFFNIGLSGQALAGWVASIWVALAMPDAPRLVVLPLAVIVGALCGAIAAAIPVSYGHSLEQVKSS